MQFTTFGLIWIAILLYASFRGKEMLQKCVIFSCLFQAGAVLLVGKSSLPPIAFSCIYYLIYNMLFSKASGRFKVRISSHSKYLLLFIITITISSFISSLAFVGMEYLASKNWIEYIKYDGKIPFLGVMLLFIYLCTAISFENDSKFKETDYHNLFVFMVFFVFVIGVWQYLSIMRIVPRNEQIASLIYSNINSKDSIAYYVDSNNIYKSLFNVRFYSCFMEPSYCSGFLIGAFAYFLSVKRNNFVDQLCKVLLVFMIILTYSATAYAGLLIVSFIVSLTQKSVKGFFKIVGSLVALLVFFVIAVKFLDLWEPIERLVVNKLTSHSGVIRAQWNRNCIDVFIKTWGIGLGYGNVRGSGLLQTLIGSLGILGTTSYIAAMFSLIKNKYSKDGKTVNLSNVLVLVLLGVLVAQVIAIPTIDYSIFWMAMLLISAQMGSERSASRC